MAKSDSRLEEYKDVSQNMRHYANMRFAQLTLFSALTAGLVTKPWWDADRNPLNKWGFVVFAVAGFVIALAFWIMEERAADYWNHFRKRAKQLDEQLAFHQYTCRPKGILRKKLEGKLKEEILEGITATNAVRALYSGAMLFWFIEAVYWTLLKVGK